MATVGEMPIEMAALGRPFQLGSLYDCRKDELIPGLTLWDNEELQKNTSMSSQNRTEFSISTSDSINEKTSALKVDASLKASLLGGLVSVSGAAKYLHDSKTSQHQVRVSLQYHTTTRHETLTMSHLGRGKVSHPNVFEDAMATHVVTAILYGADAYFVFNREVSSQENMQNVEGELKAAITKLKGITVDGEASLKMTETEKAATENLNCTFYGDFHLTSNPSTFKEAVEVYTSLPKKLGDKGEHAVPVRVWLYPLAKLDSKAARLHRNLSNDLIMNLQSTIEELNKADMRCNDFLNERVAGMFPEVCQKVSDLKENCSQYKMGFINRIGSLLPSIRGGGQEETALAELLKEHQESPFNSHALDKWLKNKEKESKTVQNFLLQIEKKGVGLDDLEDVLLDVSIETVVCFTFTSLSLPELYLSEVSNYLKPRKMKKTQSDNTDLEKQQTATEWLTGPTLQRMKMLLKFFVELVSLVTDDTVKFTVTSQCDEQHPGACLLLYENGSYEGVCFEPPRKPMTPEVCRVSQKSVKVMVGPACPATVKRRLEYKTRQQEEWKTQAIGLEEDTATLSGLECNTEYEIRTTAVGKLGYTMKSEKCKVQIQSSASPPTKLTVLDMSWNSVKIAWDVPSDLGEGVCVKSYNIQYKEVQSDQWLEIKTEKEDYSIIIPSLKEKTSYCIRILTDCGEFGVSVPSEELKITTGRQRVLEEIKRNPRKYILLEDGKPSIYKLKMKVENSKEFCKESFGNPPSVPKGNRTIMVLGATGSGKTTLINGMINYILGVEWEDKCRFKLIQEETNKTQAESQTSDVTAYQIHYSDRLCVPYSLTIIDTPGFGDTRGIKKDKEITEKIRQFFSHPDGVVTIDAVCFVVQSALARLTHTQKYILDSILSIFGKDIADNILVLVTFADGKTPPVLDAIKAAEIPCAKNPDCSPLYFKFNNSVLFSANKGPDSTENNFDQMFWKMGKTSMKKFFDYLDAVKSRSLQLTKQVLTERKTLEVTVQGLQPMITVGLGKLEEIKMTQAALSQHQSDIDANKDFEYEVQEQYSVKKDIPDGKFITNCHQCNHTCHYPCAISKDENKKGCSAMKNSYCTVCPGKCTWDVHYNMTYKWEVDTKTVRKTYGNLKEKYEEALGEKMSKENIIQQLEREYDHVQEKVLDMIIKLSSSLKRLKEIALRPDPLATPDYIDLMIQSEEQEAKPGFKQRIAELQEVKKGAEIIQKVTKGVNLDNKENTMYERMKRAKGKVVGLFTNVKNCISGSQ